MSAIEHKLVEHLAEFVAFARRVDLQSETPDNVAASLGVTRNNLTVRLHRARQQLKDRLEMSCRMYAKHGYLDCTCDSTHSTKG